MGARSAASPVATPVAPPRESLTRDRLSHVVKDRAKVRQAMLEGMPVQALCGKVWLPERWKPKGAPRCQVCDMLARRLYPVGP